ncbi:AAC(3) family N-acetyltransferase [Streptomyces sp. CAU 1734]|uniref:aminoglycoside N(3)-acetyltransferase n=1 Tax=Streptomyces sp. CAU 1734 TaxID=3140360 RepID=UPI00326017F3
MSSSAAPRPARTPEPAGGPPDPHPGDTRAASAEPAYDPEHHHRLVGALRELGVESGMTVLVHSALRATGIRSGPLRRALRAALGADGTLVAPAFTEANSDTSHVYRARIAGMTPGEVVAHRAAMPAFDPDATPSQGMGRLAESIRTAPGAVRSAHPQTSFTALGRRAGELLARHPLACHLGDDSPLGALHRADAHALMINVDFDVCTAFHLAEYRTGSPLRTYRCVVRRPGGGRSWVEYEDVRLDDSDFGAIGASFTWGLEQKGQLGGRPARLFSVRAAVDHAVEWMAEKRR